MIPLVHRELLRFWRERTRVAGFVVAPLLFWFVTSAGFGASCRWWHCPRTKSRSPAKS